MPKYQIDNHDASADHYVVNPTGKGSWVLVLQYNGEISQVQQDAYNRAICVALAGVDESDFTEALQVCDFVRKMKLGDPNVSEDDQSHYLHRAEALAKRIATGLIEKDDGKIRVGFLSHDWKESLDAHELLDLVQKVGGEEFVSQVDSDSDSIVYIVCNQLLEDDQAQQLHDAWDEGGFANIPESGVAVADSFEEMEALLSSDEDIDDPETPGG